MIRLARLAQICSTSLSIFYMSVEKISSIIEWPQFSSNQDKTSSSPRIRLSWSLSTKGQYNSEEYYKQTIVWKGDALFMMLSTSTEELWTERGGDILIILKFQGRARAYHPWYGCNNQASDASEVCSLKTYPT